MVERKEILIGRIYPAIQSCVRNRFLFLLGIFTFYSFILTSTNKNVIDNFNKIQNYGTVLFFLITLFNFLNYLFNSIEAFKIEVEDRKMYCCEIFDKLKVEIIFFAIVGITLGVALKTI